MGLLNICMLWYELLDPVRACDSRGLFKYTQDSKGLKVTRSGFSGNPYCIPVLYKALGPK